MSKSRFSNIAVATDDFSGGGDNSGSDDDDSNSSTDWMAVAAQSLARQNKSTNSGSSFRSDDNRDVASLSAGDNDVDVVDGDLDELNLLFTNENLANSSDPCSGLNPTAKAACAFSYIIFNNLNGVDPSLTVMMSTLMSIVMKLKIDIIPPLTNVGENPIKSGPQCLLVIKSLNAPVGVWDFTPFLHTGVVSHDYKSWTIPSVGVVDLEYFPYHFQIKKTDDSVKNNAINVRSFLDKQSWKFRGEFFTSVAYATSDSFNLEFSKITSNYKIEKFPFFVEFTKKHNPLQRYVILADLCAKHQYVPSMTYLVKKTTKRVSIADFMATKILNEGDLKNALQFARKFRKETVLDTILKEINCHTTRRFGVLSDGSICLTPTIINKFDSVAELWEDVNKIANDNGKDLIFGYVGVTNHENLQVARAYQVANELCRPMIIGDLKMTDKHNVDLGSLKSVKTWLSQTKRPEGGLIVVHCDTSDQSVSNTTGDVISNYFRNLMLAGVNYVTIKASAWTSYQMNYECMYLKDADGEICVGREHNGEVIIYGISNPKSVVLNTLYSAKVSSGPVYNWQLKQKTANATRGLICKPEIDPQIVKSATFRIKKMAEQQLSKKKRISSDYVYDPMLHGHAIVGTIEVHGGGHIEIYDYNGYKKIKFVDLFVVNDEDFFGYLTNNKFKIYRSGLSYEGDDISIFKIPQYINGLDYVPSTRTILPDLVTKVNKVPQALVEKPTEESTGDQK